MDHVRAMVEDQKAEFDKHQSFSMIQSITVGSLNGEIYILDGQHRIKAYVELLTQGYPVADMAIPVVVYNVANKEELLEYYQRINKHMPIHPIEVENSWEYWGKTFCDLMTTNFACYLKTGGEAKVCRCPHISMYDLKTHMASRNIDKKLAGHGYTVIDLWGVVLGINSYIKDNVRKNIQFSLQSKKRMEECEQKAAKNNCNVCYLGVWRRFEWLDIALHMLENGRRTGEINLSDFTEVRPKIPVSVREQVWKKVNTNISDAGQCYTCNSVLRYPDMECGHIVAHALGGASSYDNLMPVCKSCNRDMGIMNLYEYRGMMNMMEG
jgi:5-methylcytosine-specific restriction endonuclease McrA